MVDDFEALQGFWKLISSTRDGVPEPHDAWGELNTLFEFTGHRFRHVRSRSSNRFEIHPKESPKGMDFVMVSMKSRSPCIYELEDQTLRILHCSAKNTRPASFDAPGCLLRVYSRFKKRMAVKRQSRAPALTTTERIPCSKCGAMILPITAQATGGVCMPCKKNPGGEKYGPGIGKLGELGRFLSGKMPLPSTERTDWIELCTIEVSSGKLWIGDPLIANEVDGCVAAVPVGTYAVEGVGCLSDGAPTVYSIRARLKSSMSVLVGSKIGETGTDCAMIGICDIGAFAAACKDAADEVQSELEEKTWRAGFGRIAFKKYRGAIMAFVPSGDGDGCGPVRELIESNRRVGLQHDFYAEEEG